MPCEKEFAITSIIIPNEMAVPRKKFLLFCRSRFRRLSDSISFISIPHYGIERRDPPRHLQGIHGGDGCHENELNDTDKYVDEVKSRPEKIAAEQQHTDMVF